jgi:hypothetical protein
MLTIEIKEDTLVEALQRIARSKRSTVDKVAQDALRHYAQREQTAAQPYSFIGIGRSGKEDFQRPWTTFWRKPPTDAMGGACPNDRSHLARATEILERYACSCRFVKQPQIDADKNLR